MAYSVCITNPEKPIASDDWAAVIHSTQGVKLVEGATFEVQNPQMGELITMACSECDVEVFDPSKDDWVRAIFWKGGRATINARFNFGDQSDPYWMAVSSVAKSLNAKIVGEDGEFYDLDTGQVITR